MSIPKVNRPSSVERWRVAESLVEQGWLVSKACRKVGIQSTTFYNCRYRFKGCDNGRENQEVDQKE